MEDPNRLTCVQLRQRLDELGLPTRGRKAELVERIQAALHDDMVNLQLSSDDEFEDAEDEVEVEAARGGAFVGDGGPARGGVFIPIQAERAAQGGAVVGDREDAATPKKN